ncbi:MAG TPA: caspase family protein, partial [Myxococcaceae bacterium]
MLVVLAMLAPETAHAARRRALLVGANEGWSEPELRYAQNDARKLRGVLMQRGGFAEEDIVLLNDPTVDKLRKELERMKLSFSSSPEEETLFVFYYSGHADRDHLHLRGKPEFSIDELLHRIKQVPATQKLGILDACQSGALLKGVREVQLGFDVARKEVLTVRGMALLVSSTAREPSQESKELAGSFFTHYLVSGLFGLADVNRDQKVSLEEVFRYAQEHTVAATASTVAGTQHPGARIELTGYKNFYLSYLEGPSATLVFPAGETRCYLTNRQESQLLAEIVPSQVHRNVLVPPGVYALKCEESKSSLRVARFTARVGEQLDVTARLQFTDAPRVEGLVKGSTPPSGRALLPIVSGGAFASGGVLWILAKKEQARLRNN